MQSDMGKNSNLLHEKGKEKRREKLSKQNRNKRTKRKENRGAGTKMINRCRGRKQDNVMDKR